MTDFDMQYHLGPLEIKRLVRGKFNGPNQTNPAFKAGENFYEFISIKDLQLDDIRLSRREFHNGEDVDLLTL